MRRSYTANFRVTKVLQDHVQIIDEKKQAAWNTLSQSAEYQSTIQELRNAVQRAQMVFDESKTSHQQSRCKESKAKMTHAATKLQKTKVALNSFQSPGHFCDVPYDSIFSFQFALGNGLAIMH